jgi:hypothetical protein
MTPAPRRKQQAIFPLCQHMVKMQERRRLEHDGGAEKTRAANEKHAQASEDPVCGVQVRSALAATVQDQKLVSQENGLGDYAPESSGLGQAADRDDQVKQKDEKIAHFGNPTGAPNLCFHLQFGIRQGQAFPAKWICRILFRIAGL